MEGGLTLFCDVESTRAIGVVISAAEELAEDGVVSTRTHTQRGRAEGEECERQSEVR